MIQIEVSRKEHHLCSYIWKEKKHPHPITTTTTKMRVGQGPGASDSRVLTARHSLSTGASQATSLQCMTPWSRGDYISLSGEKVRAFIRYLGELEPQKVKNHCTEGLMNSLGLWELNTETLMQATQEIVAILMSTPELKALLLLIQLEKWLSRLRVPCTSFLPALACHTQPCLQHLKPRFGR